MKNIILSFSGFMKKVPNTIENTGLRTKNNIIQCHTRYILMRGECRKR